MSWPLTSGTATVGAATVVVACVVVSAVVVVTVVATLPLETWIVTTSFTAGDCEATTPSGRSAGSRIARTE
jgi:hypothetical protein